MTNHCVLNIGLLSGGVEIADTCVLKAMRAAGVLWERYAHVEAEEPTLAVEAYANDAQIDLVATWLEQDCIAVWDLMHREGRLVGPKAIEWGEFDPSRFVLLNGSVMSDARSVVA